MIDKEQERQRIGQRIKELREQEGLSRVELERRCGIRNSHICRIEQGLYSTGIDHLTAIGEAMGYKLDYVKKDN